MSTLRGVEQDVCTDYLPKAVSVMARGGEVSSPRWSGLQGRGNADARLAGAAVADADPARVTTVALRRVAVVARFAGIEDAIAAELAAHARPEQRDVVERDLRTPIAVGLPEIHGQGARGEVDDDSGARVPIAGLSCHLRHAATSVFPAIGH